MNSTNPAVASIVVAERTVTLEAGKNYTALLWGNARGGTNAMRLDFFEEDVPDPGNQVALRVINATEGAIDVRHYRYTATAPATPTWANVAPLSRSAYVTVAPDTFRFNVRAAGGTTAMFADFRALVGAAAVTGQPGPFDALPGTAVAGSAVTAIVFPRSVAGSRAPQTTAFQSPAITFIWDRRPPRPSGI
jgi:Domain of unknown function (DUF4397)